MSSTTAMRSIVAIPAAAEAICWSGKLTLSGGEGNPAFEGIGDLLLYFGRLANSGALAANLDRLSDTGMAIEIVQSDGCLSAHFTARYLHLGAWRILLQMLGHCREMEPYKHLTLAADEAPADPLDRESLLAQPYPAQLSLGAIRCEDDDERVGRDDFTLHVDFARDITPEELESIRLLVDDWGSLVYTGGFTSLAQNIAEAILNKPSTYLLGRQAIEIAVTGWQGEAQAIAVLVNLVLALGQRLPVIAVGLQ